jgi:hypothetical protein
VTDCDRIRDTLLRGWVEMQFQTRKNNSLFDKEIFLMRERGKKGM